jgi:hypothetical protein
MRLAREVQEIRFAGRNFACVGGNFAAAPGGFVCVSL